jgi:hypothetical protein
MMNITIVDEYMDENTFILTHPIIEEIITRNDVSMSVHRLYSI